MVSKLRKFFDLVANADRYYTVSDVQKMMKRHDAQKEWKAQGIDTW